MTLKKFVVCSREKCGFSDKMVASSVFMVTISPSCPALFAPLFNLQKNVSIHHLRSALQVNTFPADS